jgi:hypothetical protein
MAGCDAAEVLQRVERALDAPAQPVDTAIGVTGLGLVQVFAQLGAIVGFVAEHPFRRLHMRRPVGLDCRVDLRGIRDVERDRLVRTQPTIGLCAGMVANDNLVPT